MIDETVKACTGAEVLYEDLRCGSTTQRQGGEVLLRYKSFKLRVRLNYDTSYRDQSKLEIDVWAFGSASWNQIARLRGMDSAALEGITPEAMSAKFIYDCDKTSRKDARQEGWDRVAEDVITLVDRAALVLS